MIGQLFLNAVLAVPETTPVGKLMGRGLNLVRKSLVHVWDPLVSHELEGRRLLLPLSHNLPFGRKQYPEYSKNLGRIAAAIGHQYPEASAIDIGANIGDSVAIIRSQCFMPILCIEADPRYLRLFEANLPVLGPEVHLFKGFVASRTGRVAGSFVTAEGTGRLAAATDAQIDATSLQDIVQRFPRFRSPKLLKIDTDGFDIPILRGALPWLADVRPVLFFEYDPHFLEQNQEDGLQALAELREIGYSKALVYDNFGDLVLGTALKEVGVLADLHAYFSGRRSQRYMDLCLFGDDAEDTALFHALHLSEKQYFSRTR